MLFADIYYLGNPIISDGALGLRNLRILSLAVDASPCLNLGLRDWLM